MERDQIAVAKQTDEARFVPATDEAVRLHRLGHRLGRDSEQPLPGAVAAAGPPIAADVVIALATNTSPVKTADVREAFADAGWDTKDLGPLSALPTPDVMIALQELWKGLR